MSGQGRDRLRSAGRWDVGGGVAGQAGVPIRGVVCRDGDGGSARQAGAPVCEAACAYGGGGSSGLVRDRGLWGRGPVRGVAA